MSVQRWDGAKIAVTEELWDSEFVTAADHDRIVAERVALAREAAYREMTDERHSWPGPRGFDYDKGYEQGKADAEQAHAAALAAAADRQRAHDYVTLWQRLMLEDRKYRDALARAAIVIRQRLTDDDVFRLTGQSVRLHEWETVKPLPADKAAAPRTLTRDGWWPFGSFVDYDFPLEFDGEGEDGLPIWERPDKSRMQPRTLTAADPGYHSQRCLHCDHIRATHTLTAHGCIGHALPGRPGADCPCAEFIHDGEDQQAEPEWDKPYEEQSDAVKAGLAKIAQAALHDGEATP